MANLAHAVKQLRTVNGMTQEQLGKRIGYSRSQVNNVENAIDLPRPEFLTACDSVFGTGELLIGMRDRAQRQGLPSWAAERIDYEARSTAIEAFQTGLIHGFLQTADYARAVLRGGLPGNVSESALTDAVEERLRRQNILTSGQLDVCHIILDESTLHRMVGSADVMHEQLAHVMEVIDKRLATVQVLPYTAGACTPPAPVTLMTLDDGTRLAYREMAVEGQTTSDPATVQRCTYRLDLLRAQARSLGDSAQMIRAHMEGL